MYQIFGDLTNVGSIVTGVLGLLFCSLLLAGLCKGDDAWVAGNLASSVLPAELPKLLVPVLVYIPINIVVELSLIIWAIVATTQVSDVR